MDNSESQPKSAEEYAELIQENIRYCATCQPYEEGECVWIFGEQTWLGDLYYQHEVPEDLWDEVSGLLSCPNCGRDGFDRGDDVGVLMQWEIDRDKFIHKARKDYEHQIRDLRKHLEDYASLALAGKLGPIIMDEIKSIADNGGLNSVEESGCYYRARPVLGSMVMALGDMGAAPQGRPEEGRFNHSGQSVLYVAASEDSAALEVIDDEKCPSLLWMQKYCVNELSPLLDLAVDWEDISTAHSPLLVALSYTGSLTERIEDRQSRWKPQYFLTRFVADCARHAKMKGIVYESARSWSKNIAIFDHNSDEVKPEGVPYIYTYRPLDAHPAI